ncbi:MAG TPA: DUF4446 family protein [Solirubrobacteraceae bacterium]|jgi:hypothetical protein|nr:DUF4446 family protein [Solirubrobacteraceae bacterium]
MTAASLTDTQGVIALAALAIAVITAIGCLLLARSLRRMRGAQRLVLGDGSARDLIAHGASLQQAFEALQGYVGEVALGLDGRLDTVERRLDGTIALRALVRYDAYNELSGQQSMSLALLDERRCGVVLTCIHHRDQARVYVKQILDGTGELQLSPEEAEAVSAAIASGSAPAVLAGGERGRVSGPDASAGGP